MRALTLLLCLLLAACELPAPPKASAPTQDHIRDAGNMVPSLPAIVAELPITPKPPAPVQQLLPARAVDLIIAFEIGSQAAYTATYERPIWPGAASGVTVGIGYDLGYQSAQVIALDWFAHPRVDRLQTAAGITGTSARTHARSLTDITVRWDLAREVFDQTMLLKYWRTTRRVFGHQHFDMLPANAQGALTSLVFNRGGSMTGDKRVEMRAIRDTCLPAQDVACIARFIRAMKRIWIGTTIQRGMDRRRDAEADLALAA